MSELYEIAGPKIGRTVHCGETEAVSLETFKKTLEGLKADRVGHPLVVARAYWEKGDSSGLEFLKEHDIVAELCVVSNLLTGAVEDIETYGRLLNLFDEFGVRYTFSTDAPALQKTTLASERQLLLDAGAASPEQLEASFETAADSSFLPDPKPKKRKRSKSKWAGHVKA